jgi:hypothetical protein
VPKYGKTADLYGFVNALRAVLGLDPLVGHPEGVDPPSPYWAAWRRDWGGAPSRVERKPTP